MDLQLTGKKALISAGHKGLGSFIAKRLLEEGAMVAICCRKEEDLAAALEEYNTLGHAIGSICDFSEPSAVKQWTKDSGAQLDGIDICIGNASASGQNLKYGEGLEPWMKSINIDILGNALFYETAKPFLLESTAASIVQIATITAIEHHDVPITPSYGATKAAAIRMISHLAQTWGADGIRANSISPGPIFVEGHRWDDIRSRMPEIYERDVAMHPQKRMGTGDEVADVVAFLASSRSSWINGANIVVDGGYTKGVNF